MKYANLLLVDDDSDDQDFFREAISLISGELSCSSALNGRRALELLEQKNYRPDVIFLDWNMPVMNGQQFLEEIKKRPGLMKIPVVVISTSSHDHTKNTALNLGAERFITKPTNFDKLINEILSVIG